MNQTTQLPDDPALLKQMIYELLEQLQDSRRNETQLRYRLDELLRKLYGRSSEKVDPNQLNLIDLDALGIPEPTPEEQPPQLPEEKPAKRKRKPNGPRYSRPLARVQVDHVLPEAERLCPCCLVPMASFRQETHEQLDYKPASLFIVEHVTHHYGCAKGCDEKVRHSEKPPQMIEKGVAGPGLLAYITTSKYGDHLPLYRLERIFQRQGAAIPRSTMCGWLEGVNDRITPLIETMKSDLWRSFMVSTDDTGVPVQAPGEGKTRKGYLWVYLGDEDHPWVLYDYTPDRKRAGPLTFLKDFQQGYLQADGYSGYDELFETTDLVEVGCWMHCRRYFFEASQSRDDRALEALAMIRELYRIEKECKKVSVELRYQRRQSEAVPILDAFETWMKSVVMSSPPKTPMGKALTYAHNQWQALRRYTEDGRLGIDNGAAERAMRPVALGRKNWLFAGSDEGGKRAANFYSLISTCHRHKLDPFRYLHDLFQRLPGHPESKLLDLTPVAWGREQVRELATAA
jgi:transposase